MWELRSSAVKELCWSIEVDYHVLCLCLNDSRLLTSLLDYVHPNREDGVENTGVLLQVVHVHLTDLAMSLVNSPDKKSQAGGI
jgi:hypothetical protein